MGEGLESAGIDFFQFCEGFFMAKRIDFFGLRSGVPTHLLSFK